jgi:hypothetical protein
VGRIGATHRLKVLALHSAIMKHAARFCGLYFLLALAMGSAAQAQIAAPGAFSNYSGCSSDTCIWVPYFAPKKFHCGPYTYFVDTKGKETGGTFILKSGTHTVLRTELLNLSASVAVTWAANNKAFAITWSNGGASGWFQVKVFVLRDGIAQQVPAIEEAYRAFKSHYYCEARGDNVQAYDWVNSQDLMLVLSVYPTSDCGPDMGHTEAYIVRTQDGKILQHFTEKQLDAYMRLHPQ